MNLKGKPCIITFSHYGALYGANRSLLTLILALREEINWIVICRERGDFSDELSKNNITHNHIAFHGDVLPQSTTLVTRIVKTAVKSIVNLLLLPRIISLIIKNKPVAIHSNSSVFLMGAITAYLTRTPHLWHIREFGDLDYEMKYGFGKKWFRFWANKASSLICVSSSLRETRLLNDQITANSIVIYNGIHLNESQALCLNHNPPYIITLVGIVTGGKGQLNAIKALEILQKSGFHVRLRLVGGFNHLDPYYMSLNRYINDQRLESSIKFDGYITDTDQIYQNTHISLVCAENEGMGRVTVESMLRGIPVVAYDSGGTSEIIEHNIDGILYKGDADTLASEIKALLTDPAKYIAISRQARISAQTKYNVDIYKNKFKALVDSFRLSHKDKESIYALNDRL